MSKFLVTSDWHLDAMTAGLPREHDVREAVEQVVDRCVNERLGFLFAGDLCDPDSPSALWCAGYAVGVQSRIGTGAELDAVWMTGNHDLVEDGHLSSTLTPVEYAGATVLRSPVVLSVFGMKVGFLPYAHKGDDYNPEETVLKWSEKHRGDIDVVVGHLNHGSCQPGSESKEMARGRDMTWPLDALQRCYPGVPLIGAHYHKGECVGPLHIIGAPARFTFGESGNQPSYLEIEKHGKGKTARVDVKRHTFDKPRRVYSVGCMSEEERAENLAKLEPGDIIRVLHTDPSMAHLRQHEADLAKAGAAAVRTKQTQHGGTAPEELADRPAIEARATAEDGFAAAKRLAEEWPTADENFRKQLSALVETVGEQSR